MDLNRRRKGAGLFRRNRTPSMLKGGDRPTVHIPKAGKRPRESRKPLTTVQT